MVKEGKYIYCIVETNGQESFGNIGIGGRGDEVYAICFKDLGAVVSDSPIIKYTVSRENTLAHEKVIEKVMEEFTVLPVRFGTIAEGEEKIKHILENEYDRFEELLTMLEDKKELGIKALYKEELIYKCILEKYEDIRALKEKVASLPPEKTHYQRTEIGRMVENALQKEKEIDKEHILNTLSSLSVEFKTTTAYGDRMVLNAAFLVEKKKEKEFDRRVNELAEHYGEKMLFKYIGIIPPFNFVNLVIETGGY